MVYSCSAQDIAIESPSTIKGYGYNQPSYVNYSTCPDIAQKAIQIKDLPITQIHTCEVEILQLDNDEMISHIFITYGEGMDCPSGCVYEKYSGAFVDNNLKLVDLPALMITNGMWGRPPFNEWRNIPWTENHIDNSVQTFAKRNGYYGVLLQTDYRFTQLYWKTFGEDAQLGKRVYRAFGEIFVYLNEQGDEIWDYSHFSMETEEIQ